MVSVCGLVQQAPEATCNGEDSCSVTTVTDNAFLIAGISNVTSNTNTVTGSLDTEAYTGYTPAYGMNTTVGHGSGGSSGAHTCGFTNSITGNRSGTACLAFEVASASSGQGQVSCMDFDTSTLPDSLTVRSVDMDLVVEDNPTGTGNISAFKSLRTWVEGQTHGS